MTDFKRGDTVRHRDAGTEYVVAEVYPQNGTLSFENWEGAGPFQAEFYELVRRAPVDLLKVRAGDEVTAEGSTSGGERYEITGKVWTPSHSPGALWVGPVSLGADTITVVRHSPAPRPDLVGALYDYVTQRGDEELLENLGVVDLTEVNVTELQAAINDAEEAAGMSYHIEDVDFEAGAKAALRYLGLEVSE